MSVSKLNCCWHLIKSCILIIKSKWKHHISSNVMFSRCVSWFWVYRQVSCHEESKYKLLDPAPKSAGVNALQFHTHKCKVITLEMCSSHVRPSQADQGRRRHYSFNVCTWQFWSSFQLDLATHFNALVFTDTLKCEIKHIWISVIFIIVFKITFKVYSPRETKMKSLSNS